MVKFEVAERRLFNVKICMKCNAKNSWKAERCRKCVPAGTSVFTGSSFKPIEAIKVGETLNGSSVLKIHRHHYNGNLIRMGVRYLGEFCFTPEHPILIKTFSKGTKWVNGANKWTLKPGALGWKKALEVKELKRGEKNFQCVAVPKLQTEKDVFLDFRPFIKKITRVLPWMLKLKKLDEKLAELMGWYVAEGCSSNEGITFCLGSEEKQNIRRVYSLINALGFRSPTTHLKDERGVTVKCCSRVLARAFAEWFGKRAENKRVPGFLFIAKNNLVKSFLMGYAQGDGCVSGTYLKISSRSENLIRQIQMLFAKIGTIGGVSPKSTSDSVINGRKIRGNKQLVFSANLSPNLRCFYEDENHYHFPITKVRLEEFSGKVFNLTTTDGTYLLPFVVHNCGYGVLRPKAREPRG